MWDEKKSKKLLEPDGEKENIKHILGKFIFI